VVGLPGSPDVIITKLNEIFTIGRLGCNYKKETLTGDTRATNNIRKLRHRAHPTDLLCEPEGTEENQTLEIKINIGSSEHKYM
jgi:hypothetical protein